MDTAKMKELLEYKDKIKASQAKRTSFSEEWLSYVNENGFDDTAEQYLFAGFEYRRMHPFVDYLKTIENKRDAVLKFLNGKQFSKNKPKSFKMSLNLLAVLFTELPEERILMVYVIRRLPSTSIGKDKKRMPDAGKAFEKFFLPELTAASVLPDLQLIPELKPVSIAEFRALISDATRMISENGEIGKKIKDAYDRIVTWNKADVVAETEKETAVESAEPVQKSENEMVDSDKTEEKKVEPVANKEQVPVISWKSSLKFVAATIERLETQVAVLNEQLAAKEREIGESRAQISKKDSALAKAAEEATALRAKEIQMGKEIETLKVDINGLNQTIQEKDKEIADRSKLADMLSRDTSKQSDAVLKRLSSELASYYEDFMAAKGEAVTEEIGNILKDQLAEIFEILIKNGIKL